MPRDFNDFEVAAHESAAAFDDGKLWGFIRHARITEAQASEFWQRMSTSSSTSSTACRAPGTRCTASRSASIPTDYPTLPD